MDQSEVLKNYFKSKKFLTLHKTKDIIMVEIIGEVIILSLSIFIGSVAFDWWRKKNR